MTDATKASILLGALLLAALTGAAYGAFQARGKAAALHQAAVFLGEAHAAQQAEAAAKGERDAAHQLLAQRNAEVARLQGQLAQHPTPPPAVPVPPDAPVALVVAGLLDLGLHPEPLPAPLALGLTLPEGRTVLGWGREAQRAAPLAARLGVLEQLAQAQEGATSALLQQQAATDRALAAADARGDAEHQRAEALQRAVNLNPKDRRWAPGVLVGIDSTGIRRVGGYLAWTWGPVQAQVVVVPNFAGVGAGLRF